MTRIPRQLDYRLLARSAQPSGAHVTEAQVRQLGDALYASRQAAAALSCVAAGATDAVLESEAKRLQHALNGAAVELASLLASVRLA